MITRAYFRCCDPHYFAGACCIYDGWSCLESAQLARAIAELRTRQQPLTRQTLANSGLPSTMLDRTRVHDFDRLGDVFDGYVFDPDTDEKTEITYHVDLVDRVRALSGFSTDRADVDGFLGPWHSGENPIGIYRDSPDSDTPGIGVSNAAFYIQRHDIWIRVPYDAIVQVSTKEPFDEIELSVDAGETIFLPITKRNQRDAKPAFELMLFAARARSVEEWWLHSLLHTE